MENQSQPAEIIKPTCDGKLPVKFENYHRMTGIDIKATYRFTG
jgi:hypothetical protein